MTENVFRLVMVYVGSLILASLILSPIEGWRFIEGLWWAQVSSLTIGYGDFFPKTDLGKIIAMVFQCFWALYIVLCLAGHVVKFLFRDKNEMTHDEQEWAFRVLQEVYAMSIATGIHNKTIADNIGGVSLDMTLFMNPDGTFKQCPPQPSDTSYGNVEQANAKTATTTE